MKIDPTRRFGFLVNDVARLHSWYFDRLARERLGLTLAQCRLIGAVAMHKGKQPPTQAELAEQLDLTAMGVTTLCDRMESAKWIRRLTKPNDRRAKLIVLEPRAQRALTAALAIGSRIQAQAFSGMKRAESDQLLALLRKAHANLAALCIATDKQ